jgi:hypothetical protein
VGDFNEDTRLDIVVVNYKSDDVSVLFGDGNGSFANQTRYVVGPSPTSVALGDFNEDTRLDTVVANQMTDDVSVLLGDENIVFVKQQMLSTGIGSQPQSIVASDFNNDGRVDIGVANRGTRSIGIFLVNQSNTFSSQLTYSTGGNCSPCDMAFGDFNNDARVDIVFATCESNNIGIILGYGNGSFGHQVMLSTGAGSYPCSIAVGYFDSDKKLDIIVANYEIHNVGVFLGDGNGAFASMRSFAVGYGSHPFMVVVGDFNKDAKLDFVVANNGTDSLDIFLQSC